jgi:hypothetical protein
MGNTRMSQTMARRAHRQDGPCGRLARMGDKPAGRRIARELCFVVAVLVSVSIDTAVQSRSPAGAQSVLSTIESSCGTHNPYFAVSVSGNGAPLSASSVWAVRDTVSNAGEEQLGLAPSATTGGVFGLAYDRSRGNLYASAFFRRWVGLGPAGLGGIYRLSLGDGSVSVWASLHAGTLTESELNRNRWQPRTEKLGIGDLELDAEQGYLFAVNLADRRIYRLRVPTGEIVDSFAIGSTTEIWTGNARPFGLGFREGWLYHGVVDSRQDAGLPGSGVGVIYRSRPNGAEMREVLRIDLSTRTAPPWHPWSDSEDIDQYPERTEPQALISDIEFRANGDMVIGIRDRVVDLTADRHGFGDIILARRISDGQWQIDTNDAFNDSATGRSGVQEEAAYGALATTPIGGIVATLWNPLSSKLASHSGLVWYDGTGGQVQGTPDGREMIENAEPLGLGDVESLCSPFGTPMPTLTATPMTSPTATISVATPTATNTDQSTIYLPALVRGVQ